jgi:hypothetical protein
LPLPVRRPLEIRILLDHREGLSSCVTVAASILRLSLPSFSYGCQIRHRRLSVAPSCNYNFWRCCAPVGVQAKAIASHLVDQLSPALGEIKLSILFRFDGATLLNERLDIGRIA